jgi:hypothetical protein
MPLDPHEVAAASKSSNMAKKVLVTVLLLGLFCVPLALLLRAAPAGLSLHVLRIQRVQDSFLVSFAISNETRLSSGLIPVRLERLEANAWKEFPRGVPGFSQLARPPMLSCTVHKVPGRLRVVAQHYVGLTGLSSFLYRLNLHLHGDRRLNLSPFDKTIIMRVDPVEVISEEFEEP